MAPLTRAPLRVSGAIRPPGDKSISHRALILAALGTGTSRIRGLLHSADIRSTAAVLTQLGADIPTLGGDITVAGRGLRGFRSPATPLDCGNSGTTARLLAGVVAGTHVRATFTGDASLSRRPMARIADPLRAMGAEVALSPEGTLPMVVQGGDLRPVTWQSPVASAQVKSAILLAALTGGVSARVTESHLSRDHTERMLAARGVQLERAGTTVTIAEAQPLDACDMSVPADPSSAAFLVALAALANDGELRVQDVCLNPTRTGFLTTLERMGARITVEDRREDGGEPVGTLLIRPAALRGTTVEPAEVPAMIDELPMLACLATRADQVTTVTGASELRVKESDRIALLVSNLRAIGADADELPDGFVVRGTDRRLAGAVRTGGDHRVAMAFGVLAALPGNEITVDDMHCADVSYPGFWQHLAAVRGSGQAETIA